ncbi:MAG: YqgE/AlgH family protein [Bacteroidota bacterium]
MDFSFQNRRKPRKGRVLLSDPFSDDDYFGRSVVYLCEYNEKGTFGFVLNNFLDLNLADVAKNFPDIQTNVSIGGPVQTESIYFIHTLGELLPNSVSVEDGIFLGGDYDMLMQLIQEDKISSRQVRFFLGYSGWTGGQLEEEIQRNTWLVAPVLNAGEIMDHTIEDIWQRFMRREGKKYDILARSPLDVSAN